MKGRLERGRDRLLLKEESIAKEKDLSKRLGKVLPEETIKIPKIGEWALNADPLPDNKTDDQTSSNQPQQHSQIFPDQSLQQSHPPPNHQQSRPLINVRPFPRNVPLNTSQKQRIAKIPQSNINPVQKPKSKSTLAPLPFHAPKLPNFTGPSNSNLLEQGESRVVFPAGTVTTNLKDILRSKYLIPQKPLPPKQFVNEKGKNNTKNDSNGDMNENNSEQCENSNLNKIHNFYYNKYNNDGLFNPKFLPLEVFDDKQFEEYSIEELMKNPYGYSKQSRNGKIVWSKCKVINYDEETSLFLIEWEANNKRKKVARFNLRFERENKDKFDLRVENARHSCAMYETAMKFNSRVEQMPTENLPELSEEDMNIIHYRMAYKISEEYQNIASKLDDEITNNFKIMNNQLEFEYEIEHNPLIPDRELFLELRKSKKERTDYGLVEQYDYDFNQILYLISQKYLFADKHIQEGIFAVWKIFQDSQNMKFLKDSFPEILTLDQFVTIQYDHLNETSKKFKGSIAETLERVITQTMTENLSRVTDADKVKYDKMVVLSTRMLHTVLLDVVKNTLVSYSKIFSQYFISDSNEEEKIDTTIDPQFLISLVMTEDKNLDFEPSLDTFTEHIISILAQLESVVADLPKVDTAFVKVDTVTVSFMDCIKSIRDHKTELNNVLVNLFMSAKQFISDRRFLEQILALDPEGYTQDFDPNAIKTLDEYRQQITEFNRVLNIIKNDLKNENNIGVFHITCSEFKAKGEKHINELVNQFLNQIKKFAMNSVIELDAEFQNISDKLLTIPHTPEDLAGLKKYLNEVYDTGKIRTKKMESANERFAFLEEFHYAISNEEFEQRYKALQWPQKINGIIDETERTLQVERIRMIRELRTNQRTLENDSLRTTEELTSFNAKFIDLEMTVEASDQINELYAKLQKLREQQEMYNTHEKLFDFEPQNCRILTKLVEEFTPLHVLWNLANEWLNTNTNWLDTPFPQVKAEQINQFLVLAGKKIIKLKKDLSQQKTLVEKVVTPLGQQIDSFKQSVPLLMKLRHPGIKTKHWEEISDVVGFKVKPSMELTLQGFLDLHLEKWQDKISEIAAVAAQEYSIESALDQMDAELQQKKFITVMFRESGHFILHEIDEIVSLIDDQLVTTQTLLTSPFIAPVKKRATEKLAFLRQSHDILEAWIECQKSWLYLQPIFSGTSIQQKLHQEARDWMSVDKIWSSIMTLTHNHPDYNNVMHRDNLEANLKQCNELLDSITKGLNAYLEAKRLGFPRFFFLSNDELISILSHTKDFNKIQESMQKLFEYVNSINVNNESLITAMNDAEGETVTFISPVSGDTPEIEDWLNGFEEEMKNTLKVNTAECLSAYPKMKKEQWLTEFPAQVCLIANQILWTQQVTNVLKGQKLRGLKVLQTKFIEQLDQLTAIIRQPISRLLRQVVSCLLINEVHNRDIIASLINDSVQDTENFKWMKQLRYYWENDTVMVKSINNDFEYSYEYAGNSARLVITPLTDRCYQTLLAAFKQYLSGAPSGPAGTGKTETVRDCAKALGRPCVVYNCSEEVTPEQMSQFFAGLSSSGTWSCFDEFNRINIEVLSVIAQQVRSIQEAIAGNVETFQLDARTLKINVNAAICITMNPGYAGRTELPDNLKALFRPVAMMVPDFVFISEIMLFSGGFTTASVLSIKLVALFDLCRKQLSSTHHYDWGLRAMKAILSTAGKAKRNDLEADEALLLVQTIRDCTVPKLISADLPLFANIIKDVFPTVNAEKVQPEKLVEYIKASFDSMNFQPLQVYISKAVELYETTVVRHGIMLIGGSMAGKSVSWKVLADALIKQSKDGEGKPVHVEHMNPKAISISELYGFFNPVTSEWADGVLSKSIRECSFSDQSELKWIIVDGPVDSLWIETMNSLLDDNKVLCLPNNERIQLGPHVKMVFEVDDLSEASPATVSRAGMVYFDPSVLPWTALCDSWFNSVNNEENPKINVMAKYLRGLMDQYVPSLVQFIDADAQCSLPVTANNAVNSLLKLLNCYIPILRDPVQKVVDGDEIVKVDPLEQKLYFSQFSSLDKIPYIDENQITIAFERVFLFCAVWAFGGLLTENSRTTFDLFMKDLCEKNETRCAFPSRLTVFDYYADLGKFNWTSFCDGATGMNFTDSKLIEEQMIPTNESASILFLSRLLITNHQHILIQGPETSKTLIGKTLLENVLDNKVFDCHVLPLANRTTPNNISQFMISFLHKRHGQFGPLTDHYEVFLLDNLSSVKPEIYGAQPALELLRQFIDYGGWFNTSPVEFMNIVGTTLYATMGVPGGGLFSIPDRLLRHFFILHQTKYKSETVSTIILNLMNQRFNRYQPCVKELLKQTSAATLDIFEQCTQNLLPIPSKLHYIFNLRNIVRVIKGMLLVAPSLINNDSGFIKLWYHEMSRELNDRFNSESDRKWFNDQMRIAVQNHFKMAWESLNKNEFLMFNEFADGSQRYHEVTLKPDQVLQACNATLEDHNKDATKTIDIVLFLEAIEHLSNLSRLFTMQRGHALLVGVKSSGRKSLARLALHMSSIDPFEIAITRTYGFIEWREDLKNLMKQCGVQDIATGFIITDVQIIMPQQLEDLSNLMINCDIPQLFARDEMEGIKAELAQAEMAMDVDYGEMFKERCRKNLHIILVFSPYGNVFKDSMLSYPAIRSETTIDWYMPWSQNALESVATASLGKGSTGSPDVVRSIVSVCVKVHKSVEEIATKFFKETKRFTAVTPSRYFELLTTFNSKLVKKQRENAEQIKNYENGVTKITTTRTQIESMSKQLDHDIPILQKTRGDVEKMLQDLTVKRGEVEETRKEVQGKSEIAEKEAEEAAEANKIAQEQLELAQPLLKEAQDAVQKLDKDSLVNIKKLHNPSAGMKDTFDAICIMFGRNPRKVDGPNPGEKVDDYWPEAVSLLNDIQFVKNVTNFKIENITKNTIEKLKKYVPQNKEIRTQKKNAAVASFQAVGALYDWVCASFDYWFVYQEILPRKLAAEKAAKQLEESQAILTAAKNHLADVEEKLRQLEANAKEMQNKEAELTANVGKTQARLTRAQKIMSGLSGETNRWTENAKNLRNSAQYILGDSLLISGVLTYLGAFSPSFRNEMLDKWREFLNIEGIRYSSNFSIASSLGNDGVIREWIVKGLPNDTHSIENSLIITQNDQCFPLLIDPQLSGTKWLRAVEGEKLVILTFDQVDFLQRLKSCVSFGIPILIENVGLKLDPLIDPILSRELMNVDGQKRVALGGEYIPYNPQFRMYISTKYPNPQYSPEICSQVTLINFTTTQDGLTDLLLNNLIEVEREDLDKKRIQIMEASAENAKKIKEIEQEILQIVSNAGSDILDDDAAIDTLTRAQKTSANIEQQIAASEKTEKQISQFKEKFEVVAKRASLLYFCVSDFSVIGPMYQFSLKWFVSLFRNAIQHSEHPQDLFEMITKFHESIAKTFYESVSFSLFSRHKLLFSTLMTIRVLTFEKKINSSELAFLLQPSISADSPKSPYDFITDDVWCLVTGLSGVSKTFTNIADEIASHKEQWKKYAEASTPETEQIPYSSPLNSFQKLLILRIFHLQRVREGLHIFIEENLGPFFVKPPTLNLLNVFKDSDPLCPLIFIIMPGIDPQDEVIGVAQTLDADKYLRSYSLGRGRGQGARDLILEAAEKGFWVLLQNCHLSLSWMPQLEYIINNLDPKTTHPRFRLCLVTMSCPDFPIGILYQGTKLIYEIPKGMRENVIRIYSGINEEEYDSLDNLTEKRLTFHLAYFHAVVLERLQFGSIGWNIPYEFNPSDFRISKRHLKTFLFEAAETNTIPFEALSYVIGELNYGGRVTDRWDRRLLLSILSKYFSENINSPGFTFGSRYKPPDFENDTHSTLIEIVSKWPMVTAGEDVGLSKNASTITARNEALRIFGSLIEVQPTLVAASDSISEEQFALNLVDSLIQQVPKQFNVYQFKKQYNLEDTINTVLHHEILLYNNLLDTILKSLNLMQKGLKGLILIDEKLDLLNRRLLAGRVPEIWLDKSFPSILNLRSYMNDLNMRIDFLDKWVREGPPKVFNLGAFFHPEEFLTAILQVYARKHVVPFDSLCWITTPLDDFDEEKIKDMNIDEGILISGLPIEGAKWDINRKTLVECGQKELVNKLPPLHLIPTQNKSYYDMVVTYECPVFRTQNRGSGALGLPNYIISLFLPSNTETPDHWVQRSVAAFITTS
ncbi:Dynein heavy chain family protein [Tritrichomonas foetus]|uniref:Dynein-1, subspecies f n=3 Tax=Tritrichomonas foetus TaxID=1144522 RepID=A0A1J4L215_9EUKA|nr:Dynein heavy chain family protein [Tritrichomonas foetus]|eukprot:OHT17559.1 Dynein heavy chain family protein [Tritrichomonas foetus]